VQDMNKADFNSRHAAGLQTRRELFGAERTDQQMAAMNDFIRPLSELLNTYCFNDVWNRPGLDRPTRSLLNIAMLCALNRAPELRVHLNAAITNDVTKDQIQEVLLQVAVYCGVPAAVEGFRMAAEVIKERGV
jgi:4-carboxymuconolactone decarboxylase